MIEGYGEQRSGWLWPVVLLVCCVMFCGTLVFAGYVALKLTRPDSEVSPVVPVPVAFDPGQPLAADPQRVGVWQQTQTILQGSPAADDTRDLLWGLAVAVDQSRNTLVTPQQATDLIQRAGSIRFGSTAELDDARAKQLDQLLLSRLGTDPERITPERRAELVASLRAMAYGADQASGG